MKLYEISSEFRELFDSFESIASYEFDTDDQGRAIDDDGNVIPDVTLARAEMMQAWFDTLDGMEQEFGDKAENILVLIKNLTAESEEMKSERRKLSARIDTKDKQIARLKEYIMKCMDDIGVKKLDGVKAACTMRTNGTSVDVMNDIEFINWAQEHGRDDLLKYEMPTIRKNNLKAEMAKSNENIPGVRLVRTRSLTVK